MLSEHTMHEPDTPLAKYCKRDWLGWNPDRSYDTLRIRIDAKEIPPRAGSNPNGVEADDQMQCDIRGEPNGSCYSILPRINPVNSLLPRHPDGAGSCPDGPRGFRDRDRRHDLVRPRIDSVDVTSPPPFCDPHGPLTDGHMSPSACFDWNGRDNLVDSRVYPQDGGPGSLSFLLGHPNGILADGYLGQQSMNGDLDRLGYTTSRQPAGKDDRYHDQDHPQGAKQPQSARGPHGQANRSSLTPRQRQYLSILAPARINGIHGSRK